MKNWNLFSFNKVFFTAFFILAVLNTFAIITNDTMVMQLIRFSGIPFFLIFFYVKKNKINISLIVFLILAFLSDSAGFLFDDLDVICVESIFYCFAFMQLIILTLPKFKFIQFDGLIKAYLLMICGVTIFFVKVLYDLVGIEFLDSLETMLFSAKCFVLMALVFISYGLYLHLQNKTSIFLLISTVCFGFSCVLDYLNFSFVNVSSFMVLNRITYLLGLYFVFRYAMEENKFKIYQVEVEVKESFPRDNILV